MAYSRRVYIEKNTGYTLLHRAALNGDTQKVSVLLQSSPEEIVQMISHPDGNGDLPLDRAAARGHDRVVKSLIEAHKALGVEYKVHNAQLYTPLLSAVRWYFKVLDKSYLQNMTGKFNTSNTDDGYLATIKLLIKAYRDSVNEPDNKECTPLYYLVHILGNAFAAKDDQTLQKAKNVAELLMRAGAKTTSMNARLSPLALAKEKGVAHILEEIELSIISNQNQPSQAKVPDQKNDAKKINKRRSKRKRVKPFSDKKEFSNMGIVFPVLDEKKI